MMLMITSILTYLTSHTSVAGLTTLRGVIYTFLMEPNSMTLLRDGDVNHGFKNHSVT